MLLSTALHHQFVREQNQPPTLVVPKPRPLQALIPHITPRLDLGPSAGFRSAETESAVFKRPVLWRDAGNYPFLPEYQPFSSGFSRVLNVLPVQGSTVQCHIYSWTGWAATRYQGKSGEDSYRTAHL